jgi:hypothetical protein
LYDCCRDVAGSDGSVVNKAGRSHSYFLTGPQRGRGVGQFDNVTEQAMKVITGRFVLSVFLIGLAGSAYAQSTQLSGGLNGESAGRGDSAGGAAGTSRGTAAGPAPTTGVRTPGNSAAIGGTASARSGPLLNNMRANGTSLNMNPDPRAPNVTGRVPPTR